MHQGIHYESVLFTLDHIHVAYGERIVLRDVQAQIRDLIRPGHVQGQVVGLLGPSGVGKSTLFRVMAGLQAPTSGRALAGTKQLPVEPGMVGVVSQTYPLLEHRRVGENLLIAARRRGYDRKRATDEAQSLLARFGLADRWDDWPASLSGGQKQRVAIAQQVLCSESILLMDEPFSGLDPLAKDAACDLIADIASLDEQFTLVIVTHDIASAVRVSDQLLLLGRDRDEQGNVIPGARIQHDLNLVERGLPWQPDVERLPAFAATVQEVHMLFRRL